MSTGASFDPLKPIDTCPICSWPLLGTSHPGKASARVGCTRCGGYRIPTTLRKQFHELGDKSFCVGEVSGWIHAHQGPNDITLPESLDELSKLLVVHSIPEKLDLLLQLLSYRTQHPGQPAAVDFYNDAVHVYAANHFELRFLTKTLSQQGLIEISEDTRIPWDFSTSATATITASGFAHIRPTALDSLNIFVAMWFDPRTSDLWDEGIEPSIRAAGYRPIRIDKKPHNNRIDAEIMREIRTCAAVVADATGKRPNVLYEAGFAHGLGKTVVWTCKDTQVRSLPFDTRQFPHVPWRQPSDLLQSLPAYLTEAIISRSPRI